MLSSMANDGFSVSSSTLSPFFSPYFGAWPTPSTTGLPQGLPPQPAAFDGGALDAQHGELLRRIVETYTRGQLAPGQAPALDPARRAELERVIKDRFQTLNQGGLALEARPGSKLAEALATGDFRGLGMEDLVQILVALAGYAENRRNPGTVARQQSAPLAPSGSWNSGGNSYGGGGSQTGANASAAAPRGPAPAAGPIPDGSPSGVRLAESARDTAQSMNSTGWCYRGVSTAVARATGVQLTGGSAYMAADQLAGSSKFKEISVSPDQLAKLPPGAIVVWGQTSESPHGHISVSLGNGQEASDHLQTQMTSLRGHQNYRVFVLADAT